MEGGQNLCMERPPNPPHPQGDPKILSRVSRVFGYSLELDLEFPQYPPPAQSNCKKTQASKRRTG